MKSLNTINLTAILSVMKSRPMLAIAGAMFALGATHCSTTQPDVSNGPAPTSMANAAAMDDMMKGHASDLTKVAGGEGIHLSQAIEQNLKTEPVSDARRVLLNYLAGKFSKSRGGLSDASVTECKARFNSAPECAFLKPDWSDRWLEDEEDDGTDTEIALKIQDREKVQKKDRVSRNLRQKALIALVKQIKSGSFEKVKNQREGDYYRVFKKFSTWTPDLSEFSKKVMSENSCLDPEVYIYLGLKAEEFFPDEALLTTAISLYSRADQCATEKPEIASSKYVQSARFRLGLLSIIKNDCTAASKAFTKLAKMGVSDYSTRAHYWNAYCAKSDSNRDQFQYSFDELFRNNPLGFHTLTINHGSSYLVGNLTQAIDPIVKQRLDKDAGYNTWLALIEDFDKNNNTRAVWKLLAPVRKTPEYLKVLEPRVRLYLSTFAYRCKDTISLFRILDSVFRTQSEYVLGSTLKLFYPMKHLDAIVSHVKHVHPFLITAIIRQESAFQEGARSRVGAAGLMQLMPHTAKLLDRKVTRQGLYNAETNIRVGVLYFERLVDRYQGDVELALAAYNAGAEVVDKWVRRYPLKNRLLFLDLIPYAETRNYVTLIGRNYYWYSKIYSKMLDKEGIAQITPNEFRALKSSDEPLKQ